MYLLKEFNQLIFIYTKHSATTHFLKVEIQNIIIRYTFYFDFTKLTVL